MKPISDPDADTKPDNKAPHPHYDLDPVSTSSGNVGPVNYGLKAVGAGQESNSMSLNNSHDAVIAERREKAWELRLKGWNYREIGRELGVSHVTAYHDINAVLEQVRKDTAEDAEKWRSVSIARIEAALKVVHDALAAELLDPETGMNIPATENHDIRLKALDRLIKLEERKAKLLGLDAPAKVEAKVSEVTLDEIDALKKGAEANEAT